MWRVWILFIFLIPAPAGAAVWEIHVDATAAPGGDGTVAKPYREPGEALDALVHRSASQRSEPAHVILHPGVYQRRGTLKMNRAAGGTEGAPVIWKGVGAVTLTGGVGVPSSELLAVTDKVTLARLPEARDAGTRLYEIRLDRLGMAESPVLSPRGMRYSYHAAWPRLFLDGEPLPLASWPDGVGYAAGFKPTRIVSSGTSARITSGGVTADGNGAPPGLMAFTFDNPRSGRWRTAMRDSSAEVWFGGHWFWDWADDFLPASGIDDKGIITIARPHHYGLGKQHASLRVYNLVEEMDRSGESVIESARNRMLVLLAGDAAARGTLVLSALGDPILKLDGAEHVRFEGIRFTHGRSDGAVVASGNKISFIRCGFDGLGRNGLSLQGSGMVVEDCSFTRLGAMGVSVDGGDRRSLQSGNNRVSRCEFRDFGLLKRTYAPGVSLHGVGTIVENCLFHDAPHAAVLFAGNDHLLRNNEIHSVLTETGDCGAIYGGRDWTTFGNVISGNWIHDLGGMPDRWPAAIYLDDAMSGVSVRGNLVERASLGILVGGGRHVTVEGNLFHQCGEAMHLDARAIGWMKDWSTLRERLASIDPESGPWSSRYPQVRNTLADDPGKPVGTRITGNAAVACRKPWKTRNAAGVATVGPNWENAADVVLTDENGVVTAARTPLVFRKPAVGPARSGE